MYRSTVSFGMLLRFRVIVRANGLENKKLQPANEPGPLTRSVGPRHMDGMHWWSFDQRRPCEMSIVLKGVGWVYQ